MSPQTSLDGPLVEGEMCFVEAGAVTFGVVAREFTEETMKPHLGKPGVDEVLRRIREEAFWDGGLSIYVYDSGARSSDYLRFDCFEVEPHYHYQYRELSDDDVAEHQRIRNRAESVVRRGLWYQIPFDPVANGDMFDWTISRLRTRLPEMLAEAGAVELAGRVEPTTVAIALDHIVALHRATFPDGRYPGRRT